MRPFSDIEVEVLKLIAAGYENAEIGTILFLSVNTVRSHVQRMLAATGCRNRAHLIAVAYEQGVL